MQITPSVADLAKASRRFLRRGDVPSAEAECRLAASLYKTSGEDGLELARTLRAVAHARRLLTAN